MAGVRIEVCILLMIVMFVAGSYTLCGCTKGGVHGVMEGVSNAVDNVTSKPQGTCRRSKSGHNWMSDIYSSVFGSSSSSTHKSGFDNMGRYFSDISFGSAIADHPDPDMPDFFRGVSFSSNCCPSKYSSDSGCACLDNAKYEVIRSRAGNNVPISQW
jgi:hypothetical protein